VTGSSDLWERMYSTKIVHKKWVQEPSLTTHPSGFVFPFFRGKGLFWVIMCGEKER